MLGLLGGNGSNHGVTRVHVGSSLSSMDLLVHCDKVG